MPPIAVGSPAAVKARTTLLLCLACVVEGADMAVLPALYLFIAQSLSASPSQLGVLTLCRALVQALSSPVRCEAPWHIETDLHNLDRTSRFASRLRAGSCCATRSSRRCRK